MVLEIEFFYKDDKDQIVEEYGLFVFNNEVRQDNEFCCESQEQTVNFDTFVKERNDIGWRVITIQTLGRG